MNGQTTIAVPTIVITLIILAVAILAVVSKYLKNKKDGNDTDITDYYPQLIKAVQRAVSLLVINMDSFDNRDDYTKAVVSTAINYLKDDCEEFGIPADLINMMDTNILTNFITTLINENYYECFNVLDVQTISDHRPLLEDGFVACHCGVEGCVCNEGECTCNSADDKSADNKNRDTFDDTTDNGNNSPFTYNTDGNDTAYDE